MEELSFNVDLLLLDDWLYAVVTDPDLVLLAVFPEFDVLDDLLELLEIGLAWEEVWEELDEPEVEVLGNVLAWEVLTEDEDTMLAPVEIAFVILLVIVPVPIALFDVVAEGTAFELDVTGDVLFDLTVVFVVVDIEAEGLYVSPFLFVWTLLEVDLIAVFGADDADEVVLIIVFMVVGFGEELALEPVIAAILILLLIYVLVHVFLIKWLTRSIYLLRIFSAPKVWQRLSK